MENKKCERIFQFKKRNQCLTVVVEIKTYWLFSDQIDPHWVSMVLLVRD